jgi:cell division septation protein DedD
MPTTETERDTELTLTSGKLLGLFIGLAAVCAFFFGFGYMLGRGSSKQPGSIIDAQNQIAAANAAKATQSQPAPQTAQQNSDCPAGQICPPASQDLTFYKSVEQKSPDSQLATTDQPQTTSPAASQPTAKPAAPEQQKTLSPPVNEASLGSGYMVQVAAVSKREDAELLKNALQGKQYPVLITSAANDKLFHVQVGPFSDLKDAEAMKLRLAGDGYNPILKR